MEDTQNSGAAAGADGQDQGNATATTGADSTTQANASAGDGNTQGTETQNGNDAKNADDTSKNSAASGNQQQNADDEPPVRKSALEYILERKERKIQKLQEKQTQPQQAQQDPGPQSREADDDLTPEEEAKFGKFLEKRLGNKLETVDKIAELEQSRSIDREVDDFLKNDPNNTLLKEFETQIKKAAKHPAYLQVPIKTIAYGLAADKLIAFGSEGRAKAQQNAKETQTGGGSARKLEGSQGKDYKAMSQEQFDREVQSVLHGA